MEIALIGVLGTLAGTILGWVLNVLSQRGKLFIYISSLNESFSTHDELNRPKACEEIAEAEQYYYRIVLELYNSSGTTKILRNLTLVLSDGKNILYKSIPKDESTCQNIGPMAHYNNVGPINISPKTIIQLRLHDTIRPKDDDKTLQTVRKVYLSYIDEKGKEKKYDVTSKMCRSS